MKFPPIIALVFSFLIFINCSDNVSGGPGGQTTNGITATLLSSIDSLGLDSAIITLRPIEYLTGKELPVDTSLYVSGIDTFSLEDGSFELSGIIPGSYLLECLFKDSLGVVESITIANDSSILSLNQLFANKVGSIQGKVDTTGFPDSARIEVLIRGLEKQITADKDGFFEFNTLAPWKYELVVNIISQSDTITKEIEEEVISDQVSEVDTVNLYAPFNPFHYLEVRKFLNNMGLFTTPVDSVVEDSSGQIYTLNLSNMEIEELHSSIGQLDFIKYLNCEYNSLLSLPSEIGDLDSLEKLYVGANNISIIPEDINNLIQLKELSVIFNNLQTLPESMDGLKRLKIVELCFNNFNTFPIGLTTLDSVEWICLDNNNIDSLPLAIANLTTLKILDLETNNLTSLPISISHLTNLTKIDIDSNNVSYLPEVMMDSLVNIDTLELTYNSIDTSMYSTPFIQWLNDKSDNPNWILLQE